MGFQFGGMFDIKCVSSQVHFLSHLPLSLKCSVPSLLRLSITSLLAGKRGTGRGLQATWVGALGTPGLRCLMHEVTSSPSVHERQQKPEMDAEWEGLGFCLAGTGITQQ